MVEVRKKLQESVERLHRDIKGIRIGIMAIGDYCDSATTYGMARTTVPRFLLTLDTVIKPFDLGTDIKALVTFVNTVGATGGGDTPEAYELALREARKLSWRKDAGNKALVMIGDAPPHPPSYTSEQIWWRDELKELMKMGIKVYGVQCGVESNTKLFYEEIASFTGGVYMGTEMTPVCSRI